MDTNITKTVILPYERYEILKKAYDTQHGISPPENTENNQVTEIKNDFNDDKLSEQIILKFMPKRLKNKAESLLQFLQHMPNITWNKDGAVTLNNKVIPSSNICDLIHDTVNNGFHTLSPEGSNEFIKMLLDSNIPLSILAKRHRTCLKGAGTTNEINNSPPPGIPVKPKIRKLDRDWTW